MSDQTILKVERLTKTYPTAAGPLTVLHEVSFGLASGASLAVVGPSGSGKTTLLGLCAGLDRATSGSVMLAGETLDRLDEDGRARVRNAHVGFVFQNFQLIPTLTALENVLVPIELRPATDRNSSRIHEKEGMELLSRVGLAERSDHYPVQLSGGEQQRVALARALITGPKLLLADEPTGDLDARTAEAVFDLIARLHREHQLTSLIATHNLAFARRCHRVLRLQQGRVEEISPASLPA